MHAAFGRGTPARVAPAMHAQFLPLAPRSAGVLPATHTPHSGAKCLLLMPNGPDRSALEAKMN